MLVAEAIILPVDAFPAARYRTRGQAQMAGVARPGRGEADSLDVSGRLVREPANCRVTEGMRALAPARSSAGWQRTGKALYRVPHRIPSLVDGGKRIGDRAGNAEVFACSSGLIGPGLVPGFLKSACQVLAWTTGRIEVATSFGEHDAAFFSALFATIQWAFS